MALTQAAVACALLNSLAVWGDFRLFFGGNHLILH
jgi:hypothetical protein